MRIDNARRVKGELLAEVQAAAVHEPAGRLAVGIQPLGDGRYGLAVRYSGVSAPVRQALDRARDAAGEESDIREIGVVRPLNWTPEELQARARPLRPGVSIAHHAVTAGTLGAFVVPDDGSSDDADDGEAGRDGGIQVLSNNHVLADSDRGIRGDVVLQPGPADGGADPADRIGIVDRIVALRRDASNLVDAATARLDESVEVDPSHPAGVLARWSDVYDGIEVEKAGRTTGLTRGRVTAFEVDGLVIQFPDGPVEFHGQIEVAGDASGPFSAGGDSGSVVYRPDRREAVGLLFAGSERGGPNGFGLTYCNPFGAVMEHLGVRLAADLTATVSRSCSPGTIRE